jgi:hypothetical protein
MTNKWQDFEYFGWDVKDPIGKYTQPKTNPRFNKGQGYPIDDIDLTGTKSFNRYVEPYGKKKQIIDMRGYGAAERGRKFHADDEDRSPVKTKPRVQVDTKG